MSILSCGQDGDPPMNVREAGREVARCLTRELRLREGANAAGSPCSPVAKASALLQQLQHCYSSQRAHGRGLGRGRGASSSQSASSDSSGGLFCFSSRDVEGGNLATASSISSLPNAASARPLFPPGGPRVIGSRDSPSRVIDQPAGRGEPMPNSPIPAATVGRGKNGLSATAVIGKPAPKPKRKRLSKKIPTTNVEATRAEFKAKVQELTGCRIPLRPQPERPQPEASQPERPEPERPRAAAVPLEVEMVANPPARPDCSAASRISVPSPSPTVSNRIPEATFSYRDSSGSSGRSSSLNITMGYEQAGFPFPFDQEDVLPEDSGIPDDGFQPTSASSYGHHRETTKEASPEVGTKAALLVSGSVDKSDEFPRGRLVVGVGALLEEPDFRPCASETSTVPYHRPRDSMEDIGMEFDPDIFFCGGGLDWSSIA